jgi:hypothetical protein|tara:strand:- start:11267 stop:11977 length:711 start_codon:yes stop_codon:yes gene_type:complete
MTLLSIVQDVATEIGLASPTTVIGNTDKQIIQLLQMAQREGRQLGDRYDWEAMQIEATFTQSAAASQGAMTTVAGTDYKYIINDTMWNRSTQLPILGPLDQRDWQALQAFSVTGPYPQYRIQNNTLYFSPDGANATDTIAFEYKSKNWCESSGGTDQAAWAADDDVGLLDEDLMALGITWRWMKRKGLDYAEDFNIYESRVVDAMARDGGKRTLRPNTGREDRIPGILVPQGSWSV